MIKQFVLSLPVAASFDAENFLVSSCNAAAARLIADWPDWHGRACVIIGPAGSGKSHLAQIWCEKASASRIFSGEVADAMNAHRPLAVEDVDCGALDERAFFHLLNLAKERGFDLLLTARTPPGEWSVSLPDLRSRFRSLSVTAIEPPDDDLLSALLVKHFADRQLAVSPDIIAYIVKRMERSTAAAQTLAGEIDRAALAHQRRISRNLVREVMQAMSAYFVDEPDGADLCGENSQG